MWAGCVWTPMWPPSGDQGLLSTASVSIRREGRWERACAHQRLSEPAQCQAPFDPHHIREGGAVSPIGWMSKPGPILV